jgi:hypothetical protein
MTTRELLKVIRATGLTARSGFDPLNRSAAECANVHVLNHVINLNTFSLLGFGCRTHPEFSSTQQMLVERVAAALEANGVSFEQTLPDQLIIK